MNDNIQETSTVSFGNDLFFKYAFSRDNDISVALRKKTDLFDFGNQM